MGESRHEYLGKNRGQEATVVNRKNNFDEKRCGYLTMNGHAGSMRASGLIHNFIVAATALLLVTGCTGTYEKREVTTEQTQIVQPSSELAENDLLGIRIYTFKSRVLPEGDKVRGISQEIRKAEGYYIAVKLKDTLQRSGHWGPVRVVPENSNDGEVIVRGQILQSDGEFLELMVSVRDASGVEWFSKKYSGVVNAQMFSQASQGGDAFQSVYNQIANEIAAYRSKLASGEIAAIRQIAELKFARYFAPSIFSKYLKTAEPRPPESSGIFGKLMAFASTEDTITKPAPRFAVARLPSEDDPNYRRVQRIRAREHQLIDTLDQQYEGLVKNISDAYTQWRMSRLTEMNSVREIERLENERKTKAVLGGIAGVALIVLGAQEGPGLGTAGVVVGGTIFAESIKAAVDADSKAKADMEIHTRALEELGQSLATEVKPVVVEVEGSTIELKGSADAKFEQWRKIITQLHEREVGPIDAAPPANRSQTSGSGSGS
jgi:hypothetical protein